MEKALDVFKSSKPAQNCLFRNQKWPRLTPQILHGISSRDASPRCVQSSTVAGDMCWSSCSAGDSASCVDLLQCRATGAQHSEVHACTPIGRCPNLAPPEEPVNARSGSFSGSSGRVRLLVLLRGRERRRRPGRLWALESFPCGQPVQGYSQQDVSILPEACKRADSTSCKPSMSYKAMHATVVMLPKAGLAAKQHRQAARRLAGCAMTALQPIGCTPALQCARAQLASLRDSSQHAPSKEVQNQEQITA
jgi:hypothetical protein